MRSFLEALQTQRWDDHRYYHHSRINQSLHLVSALSFLTAYVLLFTHPAILGFGRPLFDDYDVPIELDLLEQRSFKQGVTMHHYAIRDESEASPC